MKTPIYAHCNFVNTDILFGYKASKDTSFKIQLRSWSLKGDLNIQVTSNDYTCNKGMTIISVDEFRKAYEQGLIEFDAPTDVSCFVSGDGWSNIRPETIQELKRQKKESDDWFDREIKPFFGSDGYLRCD